MRESHNGMPPAHAGPCPSFCYNPALIRRGRNRRRAMALLEIQNVTRRPGDSTADDDVGISVEAGEFFTLLGHSGCGKTTLLSTIERYDVRDGRRRLLNDGDRAQ